MSSTWAEPRDVEAVLRGLEDRVYGLALRALWHPQDAQDVAQEALLAIARGLPGFRGDSALETWAYRITVREIGRHRERGERRPLPLEGGPEVADPAPGPGDALLAEELELVCASGMLTVLSLPVRLAYVLCDVLELPAPVAAAALEVAPATVRQRVVRARRALQAQLGRELRGAGADERARRAAQELARLVAAAGPPPDLATPDFAARLRAAHPDLLGA
jgi:RNA polymerase sigma factor (sigma-70 family)